jgi:hypothetical protein
VVGEPHEPPGLFIAEPAWLDVEVSFDVVNAGHDPAPAFWIKAFLGQNFAGLSIPGLTADDQRQLVGAPSLPAGQTLHVDGVAHIPRTSLEQELTIVAGCPPGSQPCWVPEIAFENNSESQPIPIPLQPTPSPTPYIGHLDRAQEET